VLDKRQANVLLQEFYAKHPEELVWLDVEQRPGDREPELWFPVRSCKKFLGWMVAKGYGDPQTAQELLGAVERWEAERQVHTSGLCRPETCPICRA